MKTLKILLIGLFLFLISSDVVWSQPPPPDTPSGNPVPVQGYIAFLLILGVGLAINKLRKNSKP